MSFYGVEAVLERSLKVCLDLVAFTEHSNPLAEIALKYEVVGRTLEKRQNNGLNSPRVILGQEVTTSEGHVLVLGFDPFVKNKGIPSLKSVEETSQRAHDQGLLVIAAHPAARPTLFPRSLTYSRIIAYGNLWDGIETTSLTIGVDQEAVEIARLLQLPTYGGSDFHRLPEVGMAGTYLPQEAKLYNSGQIIDYLRKKPKLETFLREEKLPLSRNLLLWFRHRMNNRQ